MDTLVVAKQNGHIYLSEPEDVYRNLTNGKSGKISTEDATKYFKVPVLLNSFAATNPNLVDLIKKLGMVYEGVEVRSERGLINMIDKI